LAAPKAVSPLIRTTRWGLLFAGIVYGRIHYSYLKSKEVKVQARENPIRARRDERIAKERDAKTKKEMDALGKEAGVLK